LETSAILSKGQSTCKDKEHLMQRIQEWQIILGKKHVNIYRGI
jgi:hypothetical protein